MTMTWIWVLTMAASFIWGAATGNFAPIGTAAMTGADTAVKLCVDIAGATCLWCGVMEVMRRSGLTGALAGALSPALRKLFPTCVHSREALEAVSGNVAANFLGLGNAATPMGIRAAKGMAALGKAGIASDELCRLVVLNTASIQLLPTTIAAIRAAEGASVPFDILPAVWISSAISVTVGLTAAWLMSKTVR